MTMTADELLESVKRGITVPSSQKRFTDEGILAVADEITKVKMLPKILTLRARFFDTRELIALVANQREYDIPYRAVGRTVSDLRWVESTTGSNWHDLPTIPAEQEHQMYGRNATGTPQFSYIEGDQIIVVPIPSTASGYLECKYKFLPSRLTKLANVGIVSAVNTTTGVVTLSSAQAKITTATPVDFIAGKSGCRTRGYDKTPTNVSGADVTFAPANLPVGLVAGDYIALAGYSPVVQMPDEAGPVLAELVQRRIVRSQGDFEAWQVEKAESDEVIALLQETLSPRNESSMQAIVNRNGLLGGRGGGVRLPRRITI